MELLIHSKISTDEVILFPLNWACDYLSIIGLKLIHIPKRSPWSLINYWITFLKSLYDVLVWYNNILFIVA